MNMNYYRIRSSVTKGLLNEEVQRIDRELLKYKRTIESFTPQQMAVFGLMVEQAASIKATEKFVILGDVINNVIMGYLSMNDSMSWQDILDANQEIGDLIIEDYEKYYKIYSECKGDYEKMSNTVKVDIEALEIEFEALIKEGMNQKQAIELMKDKFPSLSNSILASTYKKVKKVADVKEIEEVIDIALQEIEAEEKGIVECEIIPVKEKTSTLKVVNRVIDLNGENGKYTVSSQYGVRLELPENTLQFTNKSEIDSFIAEILEAYNMM